jgi:ribose transport system substrate-binding protein
MARPPEIGQATWRWANTYMIRRNRTRFIGSRSVREVENSAIHSMLRKPPEIILTTPGAVVRKALTEDISMIYFDSLFKQPLYYLVLVVSVLGLVACSDSTQPASSNTAKPARIQANADQTRIALVMKTLTNPFFIEMERGARRAEQDLGITLVVKTAAQETSIQQQIGIVEELISDAVDAIVIAPGDSIELIPVLKKAQDSGITVINIDNQLDPEYSRQVGLRNVPFISVDNEQAAYESVQALTRLIDAPTEVAIIEGIREAKNADDRKNGAVRAFEEHPNTTIVAMHTAHWKIDEGYEVTRQILEDHPTIGALFCANDMMALGAMC